VISADTQILIQTWKTQSNLSQPAMRKARGRLVKKTKLLLSCPRSSNGHLAFDMKIVYSSLDTVSFRLGSCVAGTVATHMRLQLCKAPLFMAVIVCISFDGGAKIMKYVAEPR